MGITFLAVGGSIPEASSAVVNARNGKYIVLLFLYSFGNIKVDFRN